jgi:hypothetical protein
MRKVGVGIVATGLLLITVFSLADWIGLGKGGGIQAAQLLGIEVGTVILLIGIGSFTVKWEARPDWRNLPRAALDLVLDLPPFVWVIVSFLLAYVLFFAIPVFLNSDHQIQYVFKYIPDASGQIGFDIRAILERIENWLVGHQSPYADKFVGYPPLALVLFAPLLVIGYPAYFTLLSILTLASAIIAALVIPLLILPKRDYFLPLFLFCAGLFSYGLQFELERGQFNMIAFALCLSAIYIFHYHEKFRFFAYALFCISVQLKIYPVFFVLLFIKDWRDWKNNILRMLGLGLVNFSLLFVLGYKIFLDFLGTLSTYQLDYQSSRYENISIKAFAYYLSGGQAGAGARSLELLFLLLFGLCLFSVIAHACWKRESGFNPTLLAICTLGALIIPSVSNDYKLPLLTAPLSLAVSAVPALGGRLRKGLLALLVTVASFAYWMVQYPYRVKPEFLIRNFPALLVILVSLTALYFLGRGQTKETGRVDKVLKP